MQKDKLLLVRPLILTLAAITLVTFSGCQDSKKIAKPESIQRGVFFPGPPATPKLQFLQAFSKPSDLSKASKDSFEDYILGKAKEEAGIVRPYGVAMHKGKIYVCETTAKKVRVLDLNNNTMSYLTEDPRLSNPINVCIEPDGTIYVTDPTKGKIFVFDQSHRLIRILGDGRSFTPIDVAVKGQNCYVTDVMYRQLLVIDKNSGKEIMRLGKPGGSLEEEDSFMLISGVAVDSAGNIYATDKVKSQIIKFNKDGVFQQAYGKLGKSIHDFVRPKGIAIDRQDRIWVVDGATEVVKIFNAKWQLLMMFGYSGNSPGSLNLPIAIKLDYDNVELFKDKAVPGANIEHLVLVTSQYGERMINVYGFGSFPK